MNRWDENEDWDLQLTRADLTRTAAGEYQGLADLRGPGGATRYHVFARLSAESDNPVTALEIPGDKPFETEVEPVIVPGTPADYQWVRLGSVVRRRQYQPFTLRGAEGLPGLHSLWFSEVPRYLLAGRVERQLARCGPPEPLSGVPLGGVGAGKLELCADGRFRNFTLNGNLDTPLYNSEGTFLAVHCAGAAGSTGFVLSTESLHGLPPVADLAFEGRYPLATIATRDPRLPVEVELHARGPILPGNLDDSALPLAMFAVRLVNRQDTPVTVTVAFSMENLLGCGGTPRPGEERGAHGYYECWEEREGNREQYWAGPGGTGALLVGAPKQEKRSEGHYLLATDAAGATVRCGWRPESGGAVWSQFLASGALGSSAEAASSGEPTAAVVARTVELAPRQSTELRFVLAWYVPHFWQTTPTDYGHYYQNRFASVQEVAEYGLAEFGRLWSGAAEVPELLRQSSLPAWLASSLANDAYVFSTNCWLTRDGRFSVNESPKNMFGCMGTLDQKLYGSHYYSLFYPGCDMSELLQFARAQAENGGIQHDLGYGQLDLTGRPAGWPDLSSSLVIQTLKLYQLTGDQAFVDEMYPHCVSALLEYQLGLDSDGDGIANISGVGNTFDAEKFEGTSAYIATVWLAALQSLADLARRRGDTETEQRTRALFDKARASAIRELWNGRWFGNYYDVTRDYQHPNSHFSQLAGEFYSLLLGLGPCYGDKYNLTAQRHVLGLNFHPDLVFPTNEATPTGQMDRRDLHGWLPHSRVYMGGLSFLLDMPEEGLAALERLERVLPEVNHDNRWDQRLFYEPDTGDQHWGTFYMTAPATWYAYSAMLGVLWDKPEATLGLTPHLPASLLPFRGPVFLPDLWLELTASAEGRELSLRRIKRFADHLPVRRLRLPERGGEPRVVADSALVSARRSGAGHGYVEYEVEVDLAQVETLAVTWPEA
ncbi:MAG TPA: GH116 family glycosyl-hydrolase [Armatimonadota bacterium]|jgi:uncharacterized protein (DUF608 family)